jgi:phospholipase C
MRSLICLLALVCVFCSVAFGSSIEGSIAKIKRKFLTPIEHVVVLMLENRSFDHYLGLMKEKKPNINGCLPEMAECANYLNPSDSANSPRYSVTNKGINVQASPSHSVHGTTTQIFGWSDPANNKVTTNHTEYSYQKEDMQGFVRSYANVVGEANAGTVMDCMDPNHVPVMSALAGEYLVFDSWFASVAGPTEPNRCYAMAASSHGMSTNDVETMARGLPNKTLFRQLTELGLDWRVYFELVPTTLMFKDMRHKDARKNYFRMKKFYEDVANNDLPFYTWLEPNYYPIPHRPADDQHPDHSVADGEALIKEIYEALRANEAVWNKTALIITYDEHGGYFDHVAPPNPVPNPDGIIADENSGDPFDFARLGVRVPTVIVSPWVRKQHIESHMPLPGAHKDASFVDNEGAYEHSSLAATIAHRMVRPTLSKDGDEEPSELPTVRYLTERDRWAKTFEHVFMTMKEPRSGEDCPAKLPEPFYDNSTPQGKNSKSLPFQAKKLNDLQQDLLKIVAGVANDGANFNETAVAHDWTDETAATYIVNKLGAYFPNAPITVEEVTGQKN